MTDRELDAFVAEHVMGWRWAMYPIDEKTSGKILKPPDKWHVNPTPWDGSECVESDYYIRDFKPSTDAAADYLVLEKVRETWDQSQLSEFADELCQIQTTRRNSRSGNATFIALPDVDVLYEPGDYSRAAYALGKERGGDGKLEI